MAFLFRRRPRGFTHLRSKLILCFLLVLLVPALTLPLLSLTYLYRESLQAQARQSVSKASQHTRYIESRLTAWAAETLMLGGFPETRRLINAQNEEERQAAIESLTYRLQSHLGTRNGFRGGVRYFNCLGRERLHLRVPRRDSAHAVSDTNFSDAPFFVGAMQTASVRGDSLPVHIHHDGPGAPVVFSSTVQEDSGKLAGVIVLELDLDALLREISEEAPGKLGYLLTHEGEPLMPLSGFEGEDHGGIDIDIRTHQEELLNTPQGVLSNQPFHSDHFHVFSRIRPRGQSAIRWTAVYEIPLHSLGVSFRNATFIIGAVTLMAILFSILLALSFARRITGPVTRLAETAENISRGQWDTPLPECASRDEVGALTLTFASMTRQLRSAREALLQKVEDLRGSERQLIRQKKRLDATLQSIGDAVIACDPDGMIRFVNPAAADLIGAPANTLAGKTFAGLVQLTDPSTGAPLPDPVAAVRTGGTHSSRNSDARLTNLTGDIRTVEHLSTPVRNESGDIVGAVVVLRDVSRIRELARERNRTEKLESLGVLAGGIGHDFNNLLSVIMGDLSLLELNLADDPENAPLVKNASSAVDHARDLTRQLLTFSKGGAPVKHTASLKELVTETLKFALHGTSSTWNVHAPDDLWKANIDAGQIHQVFHNLILNAHQAMPEGGTITVHLMNRALKPDNASHLPAGRYLQIDLSDKGPGIPPTELEKIFDPYFTTKPTGTGLGLSSVYSIVQAHGGHVTAASNSHGTTFTLHLPAADSESDAEDEPVVIPQTNPSGPCRILLLDDEPGIRLTTTRLLEHLGHDVTAVDTGEEAVQRYLEALESEQPYDVLIFDLTIPGGYGGKEALRRILEVDPTANAIVSSGYSEEGVLSHYRDFGFKARLEKPYSFEELKSVLATILDAD